MTKFLIAATDILTNATVYARVSPTGNTIAFRNGIAISKSGKSRIGGLNMLRANGTKLDGDVACNILATHAERLNGEKSWVRDPRIVLA